MSGRSEYQKFGTTFDSRVLVVDNTGPTVDAPVVGRADNVEALLNMLSEVRDARTNRVEQPVAEPGGEEPSEADGGITP